MVALILMTMIRFLLIIKVTKSVSERCGKGYGSCQSSQCCSKQGWCDSTTKYCSKAQGCQYEFGKCW